MKLSVTIDRDEDGVWIVECPAIPGCVSQGDSKEQALANIREAIPLCKEVGAEQGPSSDNRDAADRSCVWRAHRGRSEPQAPRVAGGPLGVVPTGAMKWMGRRLSRTGAST